VAVAQTVLVTQFNQVQQVVQAVVVVLTAVAQQLVELQHKLVVLEMQVAETLDLIAHLIQQAVAVAQEQQGKQLHQVQQVVMVE
jgi:hypothetical protein